MINQTKKLNMEGKRRHTGQRLIITKKWVEWMSKGRG